MDHTRTCECDLTRCVCVRVWLQVLRSHVNEKKLKLLWSGREKFERLLLPSREQLERFYEGTAPSLLFLFLFLRIIPRIPSG